MPEASAWRARSTTGSGPVRGLSMKSSKDFFKNYKFPERYMPPIMIDRTSNLSSKFWARHMPMVIGIATWQKQMRLIRRSRYDTIVHVSGLSHSIIVETQCAELRIMRCSTPGFQSTTI